MEAKFMQVRSVAAWLGITKKSVYNMVRRGDLDSVRFGPRQMRIPRDSVERLIQRRTNCDEETQYLKALR